MRVRMMMPVSWLLCLFVGVLVSSSNHPLAFEAIRIAAVRPKVRPVGNTIQVKRNTSRTKASTQIQTAPLAILNNSNRQDQQPSSNNEKVLLRTALTLAVILCFASPMVPAILKSILALVVLVPLLAMAAFQIWKTFYTIEAPCLECGTPVRVTKEPQQQPRQMPWPTLCFNCGAVVQITEDNTRAEKVVASTADHDAAYGADYDAEELSLVKKVASAIGFDVVAYLIWFRSHNAYEWLVEDHQKRTMEREAEIEARGRREQA
jgi:hypothetical protein